MSTLVAGHWLSVGRADPRAYALYRDHYSAAKNAPYRTGTSTNIAPPGRPMILLTETCDALFGWLENTIERWDGQVGTNCFVFRNTGPVLSSELIREADELAWTKWPDQRHWTYVDGRQVRHKRDPGRCFLKAGWRYCGFSAEGLRILEIEP